METLLKSKIVFGKKKYLSSDDNMNYEGKNDIM